MTITTYSFGRTIGVIMAIKKVFTSLIICFTTLGMLFISDFALSKQGDFVVRIRATAIIPDENSNLYNQTESSTGLASTLYGTTAAKLEVDTNIIPEVDFTYYFTDNIAAELILAVGSRHDVNIKPITSTNNSSLGSINILPPTLTVQWHFQPNESIDPYVGLGATYARVMDNRLDLGPTNALPIHVERNLFGPAIQVGVDYNLDETYLVNLDIKRSWLEADVKNGASLIDTLDIDPWVVSVGFGMRF
jgi:outer membrane protein